MIKCFYRICAVVLALFLFGCAAAEPETGAERLTIVSWNVQSLFDGSDDGFEYNEFKSGTGWNSEKYLARLNGIAGALKGDGPEPDILALIEIENAAVIRDLAESVSPDYRWTFFAGALDGSLGMGIVSRLPLIETRTHSCYVPSGGIPRPVAEVWVDTGSGPLVLFVCHWKSKLGGESKTEVLRRFGAALILRRLGEIEAEDPEIPVVIVGDLNENYDEFTRIGEAYPCALLPDTGKAAALMGNVPAGLRPGFRDFFVVSGQKPPRTDFFNKTAAAVYSPWLEDVPHQGSFYYKKKDTWETIDHFLLNAALFNRQERPAESDRPAEPGSPVPLGRPTMPGWEYGQFRVLAEPPFTNADGLPQSYNPRTGNGLSDHLPIVLVLYSKQE